MVNFSHGKNGITVSGSFIMGLACICLTSLYEEPAMLFLEIWVLAFYTMLVKFSFEAIELCWAGKPIFAFGYFKTGVVAWLFIRGVWAIIFVWFSIMLL